MKTTLLILLTLTLGSASADTLSRLNGGHSPVITSKITSNKLSFGLCSMKIVNVKGQDPLTQNHRTITLKDYRPFSKRNSTSLKTVLLMPPTGGENILDNAYANHLCRRGFRVVLLSKWELQDEASLHPRMHDRGAIRAVSAMRNTVDYISPSEGQLGIIGTSVGAISAALAMGVDNRIAAGFFIVGGGGMLDIISSSTEENLTKLRDSRMKENQLSTQAQYKEFLLEWIKIDPLEFAPEIQGRPTKFIIAKDDVTVPTSNQWLLARAAGADEVITLDGNHFDVILRSSRSYKKHVSDFFRTQLKGE